MHNKAWFVYIVECADGTLYTGVTTDIERRMDEHNSDRLGAKYTSARRPVNLRYSERCDDRSFACKREAEIKKLKRNQKWAVINSLNS